MTNPEEVKEKNKPSNWLISALVLTVAYIAIILLAVDVTPDIADKSRECVKTGWFAAAFGCLTMNELGDFFAGAFAPLAFIWLVAAVLIQSQELKAQRTELTLTRKEFKLNREVMTAQAEYIGEQTEILRREQKSREDAERVRMFDAAIKNLAIKMIDGENWASFDHPDKDTLKPYAMANFIGDQHEYKVVVRKASNFLNHPNIMGALKDIKNGSLSAKYINDFKTVYCACERADILSASLPHDAKIETETMGLSELMAQLRWLVLHANNLQDITDD